MPKTMVFEVENGVYTWEGNKDIQITRRVPGKHDRIFFKRIKELNKEGKQGSTEILQISKTKAMVISWGKHGWRYSIYPFRKCEDVT